MIVSAFAARAGYLESVRNPVDEQAVKLNPKDNRRRALRQMAKARDPDAFCSVLTRTPITHILEEPSDPLMPNLPCLQRLWTAGDGVTSVWQVVRPDGLKSQSADRKPQTIRFPAGSGTGARNSRDRDV